MACRPVAVAALIAVGSIVLGAQDAAQRPQAPPTIRSRTTLVPVDVRVVDARGNPVTDLKRDDFVVLEDGRPQNVQFFATHGLTAAATGSAAEASAPLRTTETDQTALKAQNLRLFLFVFGRGRLQWPEKGIDGAIDFVKHRLLPQDRVAVLAYNRATDFTLDRDKIIRTLERFKKAHENIEADLKQQMGGLAAVYGSRTPNKKIQAEIDAVFGEETKTTRVLPSGKATDAAQMDEDTRRTADIIQRGEILATRDPSPFDAMDQALADMAGMTFDEFAQISAQSGQDISTLYTGIRYLRFLDGEKHLVFISEFGMYLPRLENEQSLASLANDARVVIDTLQTGGINYRQVLPDPNTPMGRGTQAALTALDRESAAMFRAVQGRSSLRYISDLTGGTSSVGRTAAQAFDQIDQVSRFEYLLGYVPSDATYDRRYHRITVRVKRQGLRVLSRHGYYARPDPVPIDRKQFMTYSRIAAAANTTEEIDDLGLTASIDYVAGATSLVLNVTVGPKGIAMDAANGRHTGAVDLAIFCGDAKQQSVCEHWQTVDFNLTDANYQLFQLRGGGFSQRIDLTGPPAFVKVIAYDYKGDALGTALIRVAGRQ